MDEVRRGQIALQVLKYQMRKDGVRLSPDFKRMVGHEAKAIGISLDEGMEFLESIVRELVEETFGEATERN